MGVVNRKGGHVKLKLQVQLTASHDNWLQGSANKMEGGAEWVLYGIIYNLPQRHLSKL